MSKSMSELETDLEKGSKELLEKVGKRLDDAARSMAEVAEDMTSPMYGVTVKAMSRRATDTKWVVKAVITSTGTGIGQVRGGAKGMTIAIRRRIDQIARGNGLA